MSFAALKKNSKAAIASIGKKFEEEKSGGYARDERYWQFQVDKAGKGQAEIRFLSAPEGEEMPYVKRFEYFVKHNGKFYVNLCRSTLGEKDPMNEHFFEVRGDGKDEKAKTAAGAFKRSTNYIANIYVVNDPANPDNNGKVFLFKFGSRIFQKLEAAIKPEFDDQEPFNPFDMWEGANFKLKAKLRDGQRSYDDSSFDSCGPLLEDDEDLEAVWKKQHSLQGEIAPEKFKTYDQLKKELDRLLEAPGKSGGSDKASKAKSRSEEDDGDEEEDRPAPRRREEPAAQRKSDKPAKAVEEDDDDMSKFKDMLGD